MNSALLSDILECSVCLRSLDEQNKVLPCQHTFCKSCLDSIVKSYKELRCPECRILVRERVSDLPSNILLIRLLDGIRCQENQILCTTNHETKTRRHSVEDVLSEPYSATGGAKDHGINGITSGGCANHEPASRSVSAAPHQPSAKALYRYETNQPGNLSFDKGDIIQLLNKVDSYWMRGECKGHTGLFPINYVKVVHPLPPRKPLCVALYDFQSDIDDPDRDCLHFVKNDWISVIRRVDDNWIEGALNDKIGIFPLSFVKLNHEAKKLIGDISSSSDVNADERSRQRRIPESRRITSGKHANDSKKRHSLPDLLSAGSDGHGVHSQSSNRRSVDLDSSTPLATSISALHYSVDATLSSTKSFHKRQDRTKLRYEKNDFRNLDKPPVHPLEGAATTAPKAPSPSSSTRPAQESAAKPKGESFASKNPKAMNQPMHLLPAKKVTAVQAFQGKHVGELDLVPGHMYRVTEVCTDGWCKATHVGSGKSGVFPGSYVTPSPLMRPPSNRSSSGLDDSSTKTHKHPVPKKGHVVHGRSKSFEANSSSSLESLPSRTSQSSGTKPLTSTSDPVRTRATIQNPSVSTSAEVRSRVHSAPKHSNSNCNSSTMPGNTKSPPLRPVLPKMKLSSHRLRQDGATLSEMPHDVILRQSQAVGIEAKKPSELDKRRERSSLFTKMRTKSNAGRKLKASLPFRSSSTPNSPSPDIVRDLVTSSSRDQEHSSTVSTSRDRYRATMNYPAQTSEELDLTEGDVVVVHQRKSDGWFRGTHQGNGKAGYFPSTFVDRIFH